VDLAVILINDSVNWSKARIQKAIKTNQTQTVMLRRKPEVYLLYWTAWVDRTGQLHFGRDLYDRDLALYKALKARPVYEADGIKNRELVR
jgi:murein L,D-transpeptidase YcbB/YkuD